MIRKVTLEIPGPPVPKARARITAQRTFTPYKTKKYQDWVKLCFAAKFGKSFELLDGPLFAIIDFHMPKSKSSKKDLPFQRPDFDNLAKCATDALNGWAYKDDAQIIMPITPKIWHLDGDLGGKAVVTLGEIHSITTPEDVQEYRDMVMESAMIPLQQSGIV